MNRKVAATVATGLTAGLAAGHAHAASTSVGGTLDVHGGYGNNPFFDLNNDRATPIVGATLTLTGTRTTATSRTDVTGTADASYYSKLGNTPQNYSAVLNHNQRVSQKLSLQGTVGYEQGVNPPASFGVAPGDLQTQTDLLTIGQKRRRYWGSGYFTWEMNGRNTVQGGFNASHSSFSGPLASSYTTYGGTLGVLHTFSARTRVGVQGSFNLLKSPISADSRSGVIGLQLQQTINAIWKLEAGGSVVLQSQSGQVTKTFGFNGSLCGTYPRYVICLIGTRSAAPTGLGGGGLRTETQVGGRLQYKLTPRSTAMVSATYDISQDSSGRLPTQKYWDGAASYRRILTPRVSVGVSGRYQGRDYGSLFAAATGKKIVTSYSGTLNLVWSFGRLAN